MLWSSRIGRWVRPGVWAALLLVPVALTAAERTKRKPLPKGEVVEIFSGIKKGQIEVQLIPRDSAKCRLLITNKTDKPLSVRLPEAFAGVPVLAQFPDHFDQDNVPQVIGTGPGQNLFMGPGMMNLGGPNMGPGPLFNVAPEKVGKLRLTSICLDHGKPNPRPRIKYAIKPINSVTQKDGVAELCAMLGRGKIGQRAAQLAAWHLNNDMSWEKLASIRQKVTFGTRPTYTRQEIQAAKQAAEEALKLAKQRRSSTGKADSLSQR